MEDQVENSYLLQMPTLVIEKILSNVLNLTNVSRTCKALYDTVCQMEKRKRVACIIRFVESESSKIDDDVAFDSIMNSHRTITHIGVDYVRNKILNERQLERLAAIVKHFGPNITSLMLRDASLSIDKIIELFNQTPKLESLEFEDGRAFGSATTTLHLSSLKELSIRSYHGLLEIVNSLPAGSLTDFRSSYFKLEEHQQEVVQTILSKQHNLKSLRITHLSDPLVLCVNHLQLEKLELGRHCYQNDNQLMEILKCHLNLKELKLVIYYMWLQPSTFEWICENLKELEVLEVPVHTPGKNVYSMLGKLKKLRYFRTNFETLRDAKFQLRIDSLAKLELNGYQSNEELNQMVQSIARTFANLTTVDLDLRDFSQLNAVLSQCIKLMHLTISIYISSPLHHFAEKTFPNIRHLRILTSDYYYAIEVSVITSIVRAMPNLKSLLIWNKNIIFDVNAVKEFILASKSLEELEVDWFELDQYLSPTDAFVQTIRRLWWDQWEVDFQLDQDFSAIDCFVETIRRLSDQLKAYRFRFMSYDVSALKDILSDEFNVRGGNNDIVLCKGVLSDFHGYP